MNITIRENGSSLVVVLEGDLDNAASSQAERDISPVMKRDDCDVVFDCTQLNYISSSGLRILLNVYKHTRANGRKAILRDLRKDVMEVFMLSGFLQLFKQEYSK